MSENSSITGQTRATQVHPDSRDRDAFDEMMFEQTMFEYVQIIHSMQIEKTQRRQDGRVGSLIRIRRESMMTRMSVSRVLGRSSGPGAKRPFSAVSASKEKNTAAIHFPALQQAADPATMARLPLER